MIIKWNGTINNDNKEYETIKEWNEMISDSENTTEYNEEFKWWWEYKRDGNDKW